MLKKIRVCYFRLYWRKKLMIKNAFYLRPRITHSIHFLLLSLCGRCFCFFLLGVVCHLTCLSKPFLGMQMSIALTKIIWRGRLILLGCTLVNKKQQHFNQHLFPLYFGAMGNISRLCSCLWSQHGKNAEVKKRQEIEYEFIKIMAAHHGVIMGYFTDM